MIEQISKLNMSFLIELLKDRKNIAREFEILNRFLVEKKCTFRGVPMPTYMKPNFISPKQTTILQQMVNVISNVLNRFIDHYLQDEQVQRIFGFNKLENELFAIEPGYSIPLVISRLDAFMENYSIKFLEFNCDSPAGTAYSDVMEAGFRNFLDKYPVLDDWKFHYFNRQEQLANALMTCYKEFNQGKDTKRNPTIAIVDWDDVSTYSEFELLKEFFESRGLPTLIASPQKLKIKNDRLTFEDEPIDIIYRRVISRELLEKIDEVGDFIDAVKRGMVCMANPFRSYIVGNKKVLAILTNPQYQGIFNREQLKVIRECLPWTQILSRNKALFNDFTVDLRNFIYDNKNKLVLKPASSYGGKDVHLGLETDDDTWHRIVEENIDSEDWIVQQYVNIPEDIFPELNNEQVTMKLKKVNINPFAINGKYSGTISRISDNRVINVSAGGGLIPTMTASKK